jgi:hypothetical protein
MTLRPMAKGAGGRRLDETDDLGRHALVILVVAVHPQAHLRSTGGQRGHQRLSAAQGS